MIPSTTREYAACGGRSPRMNVTALALAAAALAIAPRAVAAPRADGDAAFRAEAQAYAATTRRQVVAWGTVRLDGTPRRYPIATLEASGGTSVDGSLGLEQACGNNACRGAYLVEQAPGRLWVIGYSDGRWGPIKPFHGDDAGATQPPAFQAFDDTSIVHRQMHNHGTEILEIGFSQGRPSILSIHDSNRAGDDDRFCTHRDRCPALATFDYQLLDYVQFTVDGPFATVQAIREHRPPAEP